MVSEDVYDLLAVAFAEIDFGAEAEAFLRDEDGGEVAVFF